MTQVKLSMDPLMGHKVVEIFRFELNSATKVEFCLLKWTAVNGSYSFQIYDLPPCLETGRLITLERVLLVAIVFVKR